MRTRLWPLLVVLIALPLAVVACSGGSMPGKETPVTATSTPPIPGQAQVESDGGSYELRGVTVTAPKGAVAKNAMLSVSEPRQVSDTQARPLADVSVIPPVEFDISLNGGTTQPARPLELTVPLTGKFLPAGADPQQTLLYTTRADGTGYELVPAEIGLDNVLYATLTHLSPKWLVWPDFGRWAGDLVDKVNPEHTWRERPQDCASTAKAGDVSVRFGRPQGWGTGRNSAVHPCLVVQNGQLAVRLVNNSAVIWSVTASRGTSYLPVNGEGVDARIIKLIASKLWPEPGTQTYLSRSSELGVNIPTGSLPARVELKAGMNTFSAESAWVALNMVVGLMKGDLASSIESLLDVPSAVGCLQDAVRLDDPGGSGAQLASRFIGVFVSKCGEAIAEALGGYTPNPKGFGEFWKDRLAVASATKNGLINAYSGFESAARTAAGVVVVSIERVQQLAAAPSTPATSPCLTAAQFLTELQRTMEGLRNPIQTYQIERGVVCAGAGRQPPARPRSERQVYKVHPENLLGV